MPLRTHLAGHSVDTAYERGWSDLKNGELLERAQTEGYQLVVTTDQNLKYQQQLSGRTLAIVVLLTTSWPRIKLKIHEIALAVNAIDPGDYIEVTI